MSFNTSNLYADTIIADVHYVEDLAISKNEAGNMVFEAPVIEAVVVQSSSVIADSGVFTYSLNPLVGDDTVFLNGNMDFSNVNTIKNLKKLTVGDNLQGSENQVLSLDSDLNLLWKSDNASDVSQWSTFNSVSDVQLGSYVLNGSKTITDDVNTSYLRLPKDQNQDVVIELNSFTSSAKMPTLKVDNLDTVLTESTQINVLKNLNLSDKIIYAGTGNFGNSITSVNTFLGVEPNRFTGIDAYTLQQLDNNNTIQSLSNADIIGFHDVESLRGQFLTTDELGEHKFTVDSTGSVVATSIQTPLLDSSTFKLNMGCELHMSGNKIVITDDAINPPVNVWDNQLLKCTQAQIKGQFEVRNSSNLTTFFVQPQLNQVNTDTSTNLVNFGKISCSQLKPTYIQKNTLYVSSNGDDLLNNGSFESPFLTIGKAISIAESQYNNEYWYIMIGAGSYNENLNITKKMNLIGMGTSPYSSSVGCVIGGSVTINISQNGADMFNNCVNISGVLIGSLVSFVSTENSILNIENCFLYSDDNTSGRALYFNPSSVNSRLRITNSIIISGGSQGLDPLVEITKSSSLTINNVILSAKGVQNVLLFSGTATCDTVNNCKIENSVVSAVAPALVRINSTNSGTYTFTNCGFIYSDSTNKAASPLSSGILCNGVSGNPRVVVLYCSFFLFGTTTANYAVEDSNHSTPTQMICLYYMNGASLQNAFSIHANNNQNKFQLQIVS
jgi:hypothetical protein